MNTFNFKSYFTFLGRHKAYTAVNIFGFSVSLMFVILIGLYTSQEYSTDSMHSKADRICLIGSESGGDLITGSNHGFMRYLASRYPEIDKMCTVVKEDDQPVVKPTGEVIRCKFLYTDSTFYQLFDFPIIKGDRNHVLDNPNDAVISDALAHKLFGSLDPVGRDVVFYDSLKMRVSGVMGSMKGSSIPEVDVVTRFDFMRYVSWNVYQMNNFGNADVFILTKPGASLAGKEKDLTNYFKTFSFIYQSKEADAKARVIPFKGSYFSDAESYVCDRGSTTLVDVLFAFGVIVLLFSVMNYVNLTVAQSARRAKEIATRRLFGAQRGAVALQLVGESITLCVVSLLIGIVFAAVLSPMFGKLLNTDIMFLRLFSPQGIALLIAIVLLTGVLAGLIPSVIISRANPIDVVRGTFRHNTRMRLGKLSISFQNLLTIVMVAVSLTMVVQTRYWINAPLGWNREGIVEVPNNLDPAKAETFMNEVKKLSCVALVSACWGSPLSGGFNNTSIYNGKTVAFQRFHGDENFMKILGIEVANDYHVADPTGCYVSKNIFAVCGIPANSKSVFEYGDVYQDSRRPIRGILKDLHLGTITNQGYDNAATMVFVHKGFDPKTDQIFLIKLNGNLVAAYDKVKEVYKRVYNEELVNDTPFIDQQVEKAFENVSRLSTIVSLFAAMALLISLLGLIAMTTYYTDQHRREIAIRKVFGSTNSQIRWRFVRMFLFYVVAAIVVAAPLTWWIGQQVLMKFPHRISLWPCIIVACAFCLLCAYVAVYVQCSSAANENPINHVKDNE